MEPKVATLVACLLLVRATTSSPAATPSNGNGVTNVPAALVATVKASRGGQKPTWHPINGISPTLRSSYPRLVQNLDERSAITYSRCAEALSQGGQQGGSKNPSVGKSPGAVSVYKKRADSVVRIMTPDGEGAGVVIDKSGLIATNYHVVENQPTACILTRSSEMQPAEHADIFVAHVIAAKPSADLALLRVPATALNVQPVPLGSLKAVRVGDDVFAIGHPLGYPWSLSQGIVSQIRPEFEVSGYFQSPSVDLKASVIQTQTPISSGNSGGPLFNGDGQVIGLVAFAESGGKQAVVQGLNMAIAVSEIDEIVKHPPTYVAPKSPALPKNASKLLGKELPPDSRFQEVDINNDGINDAYAVDVDSDDEVDFWILDSNHNGVADGLAINLAGSGPPNFYVFDEDEDGVIDKRGLDVDGDGTIDYWLSNAK
ncbi:MAG TPA: serine protease [Candidatus Polarisedimenticolaceae bacterium]|nr:serine protease [Candidatus Polarisedimenticolaceae bacterium]